MRFFFTGPRVMGIRPGISLGASDFRRAFKGSGAPGKAGGAMTGGFVYVIADESGRHKIGSSRDPISRIATLQTGTAEKLSFSFIGVAPGMTYARIERAAHDLLDRQKIPNGGDEWFLVPASIAIGAVYEAAQRLAESVQQVSPQMVPQIIYLANQPDPNSPSEAAIAKHNKRWGILAGLPWWLRHPIRIAAILMLLAVGLFIGFVIKALIA
jgi:hypothetical protein